MLSPATPPPAGVMIRMSPLHQQSITPAGEVLWIFLLQPVSLALSLVNYDSELVGSWCGKQGMLLPETVAS